MRIVGVHHVAIVTPDIERLRAFYVETLGFPVVGGFPGHGIVFIAAEGVTIEVIEEERPASERRRPGWDHLAWEVEDVDAAYAALKARGVPFHAPPEDFPPEAPTVRLVFFADPDGNALELLQPLKPAGPDGREQGPGAAA
jgi:catechol 2,3-dioxygenase-like lactoylglutathione lyase family enzyme